MLASYKKLVRAISSKDKLFFVFLSLFLLISIPITVYGVLQSRDLRTEAVHQDCFDLNGDFIVTMKDVDLVVDHFGAVAGSSNYVAAYDLNHDGSIAIQDITIEVKHFDEKCLPVITFSASTTSITKGGSVRLSWNIKYSTSRNISPGIGSVGSSGSIRVFPGSTTTYKLTASNQWGSRQAQKTITVSSGSVGSPPAPGTSGGDGSTSSNILQSIKFKISVPYLIGKLKIPVIIKNRTKEIEVSGGKKEYTIGVKKDKFKVGDKLTIIVGGNKTLTKKFAFTPKKNKPVVNVGNLFLGDVTGDNKIDGSDKTTLLDSIANQTDLGDVNIDGVANSLDWAILLVNFGRKGSL